jgi:hypothetical protein
LILIQSLDTSPDVQEDQLLTSFAPSKILFLNLQNKIDEPDYYTTLGHPSTLATDDSNGSLNARFERQMEFVNKSNRPFVRSHKNRRGEKSQRRSKSSSRRSEREEQVRIIRVQGETCH